jgi:DNA-binding NarL/FixJ family response regulator
MPRKFAGVGFACEFSHNLLTFETFGLPERGRLMRETYMTVLVEPKALIREGLVSILHSARFQILMSAVSIDKLVHGSLAQYESVLLILGSGVDPASATRQIELFRKENQRGRAVVLADQYDASDVISAFRAGASGYLVKVTTSEALIKSLELVMLGETIMPGDFVPSILDRGYEAIAPKSSANEKSLAEPGPDHVPHLSGQEKRVLSFLVEGHSNKVIARRIDIAEATVKVHIKAILRKVRVQNRTQAAVWAMSRSGLASDARMASG